ncbi:MAG: choline BCCT transporter BetT [Gammaproteobacteria bacterium]
MSKSQNNTRHEILSHINPTVFFGSALLILAFVIFGAAFPHTAEQLFSQIQAYIVHSFGWFYLLAVAAFLLFCVGIALSSYGHIKLGPDHSEPEFSYLSWFAMLFSAGMGIGLLFFGVAEPVMHFSNPPVGEGNTVAAAREAMSITFFHWGIHAWAIYAIMGLSLAYFGFRHDLPLTVRSALYPIIGKRIYGPIGHVVDIFAVLGTMFGVATSLGLGVLQVNAGLNYLFDVPEDLTVQIILIAVITLFATGSVVAGLNAGIRRLSELNLFLAVILLLFMLIAGPTLYLLQTLVENTGNYLTEIVDKTFTLYAYEPTDWIGGWTLFYWAWWIAWSPFVGMFIARVSRGRTIREFILGVLFVPVGFTFLWMTFFGNTAIYLELHETLGVISAGIQDNVPTAIFRLFEHLPLTTVASVLATILVITFFVTSSDSGSLVIDIITSGGDQDPPVWQRIFWATSEGVVAAVLLVAGGLVALQTAAIASALPFTIVMLVVTYGLFKGLRMEGLKRIALGIPPTPSGGSRAPWQARLRTLISHPPREEVEKFLANEVKPALQEAVDELRALGRTVEMSKSDHGIGVTVFHADEPEFVYSVNLMEYLMPDFAFPEVEVGENKQKHYYRAEVHLLEGSQNYDIMGYNRDQILADFIHQYEKYMHFLHISAY